MVYVYCIECPLDTNFQELDLAQCRIDTEAHLGTSVFSWHLDDKFSSCSFSSLLPRDCCPIHARPMTLILPPPTGIGVYDAG